MTQTKEMSDRDLNLALAELMNYPKSRFVPNYCTDAAASLEVQTAAIAKDTQKYINNLALIRLEMCIRLFTAVDVAVLILASPRERAEAAYITLQGQ